MIALRRLRFTGFFSALLAALSLCTSPAFATGGDLGDVITSTVNSFENAPNVLSALSYLMGIVLGTWAIFKFKDHVDSPGQTPLSEGVKRLLAGGMFLALPMSLEAIVNTMGGGITAATFGGAHSTAGAGGGSSLDEVAVAVMSSVSEPLAAMLSGFSYLAGICLALVGISRLTKSTQEGPRGPAGIGTLMTFVSAGALMSVGSMMGAFSTSLFGTSQVRTFSVLRDDIAADLGENAVRVQAVIDSCLAFLIFVGWIAFLRGWFVLKAVADGNSSVSIMQAFTFLFGGAMAVNLGPLINAISETLGIAAAGVTFGGGPGGP